jgi:hypothetical protein
MRRILAAGLVLALGTAVVACRHDVNPVGQKPLTPAQMRWFEKHYGGKPPPEPAPPPRTSETGGP